MAAAAAYGGVAADVLVRAGTVRGAFAPSLAAGSACLVAALVFATPTLGAALWIAGGTYVAFLAAVHPALDASSPFVAAALLLCGELAAWSLDERWRIRAEGRLAWRRAAALGLLALGGLAAAALVVALTAVPPSHAFVMTVVGALAAVAAAGTGIRLARR